MNIPLAELNFVNEKIKMLKQTIEDNNTIISDKWNLINESEILNTRKLTESTRK